MGNKKWAAETLREIKKERGRTIGARIIQWRVLRRYDNTQSR